MMVPSIFSKSPLIKIFLLFIIDCIITTVLIVL